MNGFLVLIANIIIHQLSLLHLFWLLIVLPINLQFKTLCSANKLFKVIKVILEYKFNNYIYIIKIYP